MKTAIELIAEERQQQVGYPHDQLIQFAALIATEIDRLLRLAKKQTDEE